MWNHPRIVATHFFHTEQSIWRDNLTHSGNLANNHTTFVFLWPINDGSLELTLILFMSYATPSFQLCHVWKHTDVVLAVIVMVRFLVRTPSLIVCIIRDRMWGSYTNIRHIPAIILFSLSDVWPRRSPQLCQELYKVVLMIPDWMHISQSVSTFVDVHKYRK